MIFYPTRSTPVQHKVTEENIEQCRKKWVDTVQVPYAQVMYVLMEFPPLYFYMHFYLIC